jgi:hypothetical protein
MQFNRVEIGSLFRDRREPQPACLRTSSHPPWMNLSTAVSTTGVIAAKHVLSGSGTSFRSGLFPWDHMGERLAWPRRPELDNSNLAREIRGRGNRFSYYRTIGDCTKIPRISATWAQVQERATRIRKAHRAERLEDDQHMKISGGQQLSKSQAQKDLVTGKIAPRLGYPLSATRYQCYGSGLMSRRIPWPRKPRGAMLLTRGFQPAFGRGSSPSSPLGLSQRHCRGGAPGRSSRLENNVARSSQEILRQ